VYTGFWWGNLRERGHLEDLGLDGIFRKCDVGTWTGFMWPGMGQVAGTCKCDNEPSGCIKCGESDNRLASREGVSK